jgi:hypothetical protein
LPTSSLALAAWVDRIDVLVHGTQSTTHELETSELRQSESKPSAALFSLHFHLFDLRVQRTRPPYPPRRTYSPLPAPPPATPTAAPSWYPLPLPSPLPRRNRRPHLPRPTPSPTGRLASVARQATSTSRPRYSSSPRRCQKSRVQVLGTTTSHSSDGPPCHRAATRATTVDRSLRRNRPSMSIR